MLEKPRMPIEGKRVEDVDIAWVMAEAENPFRKKMLGILKPSENKVNKGERNAENIGAEEYQRRLRAYLEEHDRLEKDLGNELQYYASKKGRAVKIGRGVRPGFRTSYETELQLSPSLKLEYGSSVTFNGSGMYPELKINGKFFSFFSLDNDTLAGLLEAMKKVNAPIKEEEGPKVEAEKQGHQADLAKWNAADLEEAQKRNNILGEVRRLGETK